MAELEQLLGLFVAALILAAADRRVGAPYPVFLALGGALLAFLPGARPVTIPPEVVLAPFVAPVQLDAAYDASLRDLRENWAPVAGLVVFAVGLTTAAVALVVHLFVPAMAWAAAIAVGAIVARRGKRFSLCVPTTRSETMPFTRSKRNWIGSTSESP